MNLGAMEVAALAVLALLVFGPQRLPEIARNVGKAISAVRREARDTLDTLRDEAGYDDLRGMASDLRGEAAALKTEADELRAAASLTGPLASPASARRTLRDDEPAPYDPQAL